MAIYRTANENPWYILMTLEGEQEGSRVDEKLAVQNRRLWNAWSRQALTDDELETVSRRLQLDSAQFELADTLVADIEDRFQREYKRRNPEATEIPLLPDPKRQIDLSQVRFQNSVILKNAIFCQNIYLNGAAFAGIATFQSAVFAREARFESAGFAEDANFSSTVFLQKAAFRKAAFEKKSFFNSSLFENHADFRQIVFHKGANFQNAIFGGNANFGSATIKVGDAEFDSLRVKGDLSFDRAEIHQSFSLNHGVLEGFASFEEATFGIKLNEEVVFTGFSNCQFQKPTSFRNAMFNNVFPEFNGTQLHTRTQFTADNSLWPLFDVPSVEKSKESCAAIRHVVAAQGLPEHEQFFYRREMHFAGISGSRLHRLPFWIYRVFSSFGSSIARPIVSLGLLWAVGLLIYLMSFEFMELRGNPTEINAAGLSAANMFKFLGFQRTYFDLDAIRDLPWLLDAWGAFQTVAAFILLFFLGLGLRTRFRLR